MKYDKYTVHASRSYLNYRFQSRGPKGVVKKQVTFEKLEGYANTYNLCLGDRDSFGDINYLAVTDNKDSLKVLATVALIVIMFFENYPDARVFVKGATRSRTRLYKMAIAKNLSELQVGFNISGMVNSIYHEFEPGVDYEAFIIRRKEIHLHHETEHKI